MSKDKGQNYEEHNNKMVFGYNQTKIERVIDVCSSEDDEYNDLLKRLEDGLPCIRDENGELIPLSQEPLERIAALINEAEESDLSV